MEKAKEKKSYTAPVVRSVSFKVEQGFAGSPEAGAMSFFEGPTESYQRNSSDNLNGDYFKWNF